MLAGNYFPPSGEAQLLARASSLMIPLLILLVTHERQRAARGLAIARRREIAVRLSLGAARAGSSASSTESVLLAVAAGALALLVIWILLRVVERASPTRKWPSTGAPSSSRSSWPDWLA